MKKQIRIATIIGYLNMAISAIVSMLYIPFLTRIIGNSEYGIYQLMGSLISYFTTAYTSLNASVLKSYVESFQKDLCEQENTLAISRRIFRAISLFIILISFPVVICFKNLYHDSLSTHEINESIIVFSVMVINILVYLNNNIYSAAIQAHEHFIFRKTIDLIAQCIQPLAVIAFVTRYPYALTIAMIQLCMNFSVSILNYTYSKYKIGIKVVYHHRDIDVVKNISKLTISVLGVAIADQIFWKTDQLILGNLFGTTAVTSYSIPTQINAMYINLGTIIGGMLLPSIINLLEKKDNRILNEKFCYYGKIQTYILSFFFFGIVLYSDELMSILYSGYSSKMYAVLILLSMPYTIDLLQNSGNSILQAKNLYKYRAIVLLCAAVVNIFITISFSKKYGMVGAALATAISISITSGLLMNAVYSLKVGLDIKSFWKTIIPIWIKLSPILLIGISIKEIKASNEIITFIIHAVLYTFTYFIILIVGLNKKEKERILIKIKR